MAVVHRGLAARSERVRLSEWTQRLAGKEAPEFEGVDKIEGA